MMAREKTFGYTETQELVNLNIVTRIFKMPIGRPKTNGGTDTKDKKQ